jgi:hypothetical protein
MKRINSWFIAIVLGAGIPTSALADQGTPTVKLIKAPKATLVVLVPKDTISQFMRQVSQYSSDQGFHLSSRATRPDHLHFIVNLERSDAQIIALNSLDSVDPAEFSVMLYDPDAGPKLQTPEITDLLAQLQSSLCKIRGVTCSESLQ